MSWHLLRTALIPLRRHLVRGCARSLRLSRGHLRRRAPYIHGWHLNAGARPAVRSWGGGGCGLATLASPCLAPALTGLSRRRDGDRMGGGSPWPTHLPPRP